MSEAHSIDLRIAELETRVARLGEFNTLLLKHILRAQNYNAQGLGPSPETVHRWVRELSDEAWNKYRHTPGL